MWGSRRPVIDAASPSIAETAMVALRYESAEGTSVALVNRGDSVLRGYIDRIEPTAVTGWACDMRDPDASIAIEAIVSDGASIVMIADSYRNDVKEAGFGNGNHGFRIDTSALRGTLLVRFFESKALITPEPIDLDARGALLSTIMPRPYVDAMQFLATKVGRAHAALADRTP